MRVVDIAYYRYKDIDASLSVGIIMMLTKLALPFWVVDSRL